MTSNRSHAQDSTATMNSQDIVRPLLIFIAPAVIAMTLSGCTLLGLGAAAGATVGGCALLDENEDDRVSEAELSAGLFRAWDMDADGVLSESEFEDGVDRSNLYEDWADEFDAWDANDDGALNESEFASGVTRDQNALQWADRRCDELGL